MSFSDYLEQALLDHVFKNSAYTQPTNIYVALSTADPLDDASGLSEPSGGNYSRVQCNSWTRTGSQVANTSDVQFPTASASWGTITHFALMDASTGGNMLGHGSLTVSYAVGLNGAPKFSAGLLTCTLD